MPFDFGNIYAMTKDDFQKAIDYYRSRIELIVNDETVSVAVKRWFVKQYNKKIKKLETSYSKLQETINQIESRGVFVNEESATLNSLTGSNSSNRKPFKNLGVGKARHNLAQILRIVGAICLPLIGSIPFGIAFHRSRKKYKLRQQENIELGRFINDSNRTFDAALISTTPFTEKEMQDLLNTPTELARLTSLTSPTNTSLSPDQKKILTKKLATLKTFAQKHGYSVAGLTDPKFNTSADTVNADYTSATATAPANLKQASDKIEELTEIRKSANDLLEADKDNDHLKALVSRIDSTIASYKTMAAGFVSTALSEIDAGLIDPTATDKAGLTASNASLDSTYNTPHAKLGVDLATAKKLADDLKIDITGFAPLANKYSTLKSNNNSKLDVIKKREAYEADLTTVTSIIGTVNNSPANHVEATTELAKLEQVKTLLDKNKSYHDSLSVTDAKRTEYDSLFSTYTLAKSEIEKQQRVFSIDESDFSIYASTISANAFIGTETKDELDTKKLAVQSALDALKDTKFDELFDGSSRMADLINSRNEAQETINKINAKLAQIEKDNVKTTKNITLYENLVNSSVYNPVDTIEQLLTNLANLDYVIKTINEPSYKVGIESEVDTLTLKATEEKHKIENSKTYKDYVSQLKTKEGLNELIKKAKEEILKREKKSTSLQRKDIDLIRGYVAEIEKRIDQAEEVGLKDDLEAILARGRKFLEDKHYNITEEVKAHS